MNMNIECKLKLIRILTTLIFTFIISLPIYSHKEISPEFALHSVVMDDVVFSYKLITEKQPRNIFFMPPVPTAIDLMIYYNGISHSLNWTTQKSLFTKRDFLMMKNDQYKHLVINLEGPILPRNTMYKIIDLNSFKEVPIENPADALHYVLSSLEKTDDKTFKIPLPDKPFVFSYQGPIDTIYSFQDYHVETAGDELVAEVHFNLVTSFSMKFNYKFKDGAYRHDIVEFYTR
jgi:hypothetical protein